VNSLSNIYGDSDRNIKRKWK